MQENLTQPAVLWLRVSTLSFARPSLTNAQREVNPALAAIPQASEWHLAWALGELPSLKPTAADVSVVDGLCYSWRVMYPMPDRLHEHQQPTQRCCLQGQGDQLHADVVITVALSLTPAHGWHCS